MNKKLLILFALCCWGWLGMAQSSTIVTGTVFFGIDQTPTGGYPVFYYEEGSDAIEVVETEEDGSYEIVIDLDLADGDQVNYIVESFDICTGEIINLDAPVIGNTTQVFTFDFFVCSDSNPPPPPEDCDAFFTYESSPDDPLTIQFFDLSYSEVDFVVYEWDFGDGTVSNEAEPTHTYAEAGTYDVTLTITADDCVSTFVSPVFAGVDDPCNCDDVFDPVCVEDPVFGITLFFPNECEAICAGFGPDQFSDCEDDCICPDIWDPVCVTLDDGTILTFGNACEAECEGYIDYVSCDGTGNDCNAIFDYLSSEDDPLTIIFADFSNTIEGEIISWEWDFGDGNTSTEQNPTHTYAEPGDYLVTLTIATSEGCTATITFPVWVGDMGCVCPDVIDPVCVFLDDGTVLAFSNSCEAECAGFFWYQSCGGSGGDCVAAFEYETTTDNLLTVVFTNFSSTVEGEIVSWEWDFGDGNMSNEENPTHTYDELGDYLVTLTITTSEGCTATVNVSVWVGEMGCGCDDVFDPVCVDLGGGLVIPFPNACEALCAGFGADSFVDCEDDCICPDIYDPVCVQTPDGIQITFTNECEAACAGYGPDNFVDCDIDTPCDCYLDFDPVCVVENGVVLFFPNACFALCEGFTEDQFGPCDDFVEECFADFYMEQVEPDNPLFVQFTDASSTSEGDIIEWMWNFGDGTASMEQSPTHEYAEGGIYEVTLTIITSEGCTSTWTQHICIGDDTAYEGPDCQAIFFFDQHSDDNLTFTFADLSFGAETWNWDFGDGNTSDEQNPTHTYADAGVYTVTLTIASEDCTSTISIILFTDDDIWYDSECTALFVPFITGEEVFFLNLSSPDAIAFFWDFGDGTTSTEPIPAHQYDAGGSYTVTLTITTTNGCSNTYEVTIDLDTNNIVGSPSFRTTSTGEVEVLDGERLAPNPATNQLTVDFNMAKAGATNLIIRSLDGRAMQTIRLDAIQGANQEVLNIQSLVPGLYVLQLQTADEVKTLKFVKE